MTGTPLRLRVLSDFHHWSNLYSEDLSSQKGHSRKCRDMANSIWEQRCLGLSETLCYRNRRGAMRGDSARMVVRRGSWPVRRWNQGWAISWCEGLEPLLESPQGEAAVAERSKNSHRRDVTLGTQGERGGRKEGSEEGDRINISQQGSQIHSQVPLGATYHTKWLKLLTAARQDTNRTRSCRQNGTRYVLEYSDDTYDRWEETWL